MGKGTHNFPFFANFALKSVVFFSLKGKNLAVMVAYGNRSVNGIYADAFCRELSY